MEQDFILEVSQRLTRIETKIDSINDNLKVLDNQYTKHDERLTHLEKFQNEFIGAKRLSYWIIGAVATVTTVLTIIFHFI